MKFVWNVLSVGLTAWMANALCHHLGPKSYGTPSGTIAFAGISLLAALVAALLVIVGSSLFNIKDMEEKREAFWLVGLLIPVGLGYFFLYSGKWLLMLIGIIGRGGTAPDHLRWLFS